MQYRQANGDQCWNTEGTKKKTIPHQSMWQILKDVIGGEPIKVGYDIVWPIKSLNLEIFTKPRPNPSHSSFVSGRPRY